jgi:hypothetical protein
LVTPSRPGSTRRQYNSGGHGQQHHVGEDSPHFTTLTDVNFHGHDILHEHEEQIHPVENIETIEQVHGDNDAVILYQLELQDVDLHRDNNQSIPFTTIQPMQDPLRMEDPVKPNTVNKTKSPSTSKSRASGRRKSAVRDDALSDRSSSNNTHSQSVVDLMTDEEIPPRGEISEYEESSSNTSSFHSANDDTVRAYLKICKFQTVLLKLN